MRMRQTVLRRNLRTLGTLVAAGSAQLATAQAIFTTTSGNQDWNADANWSTSPDPFPNAAGASVRFNNPADNQTVLLNVPITVGEIQWRHSGRNVDLSAGTAGTLTLDANGGGVAISTTSRSAAMNASLPVAFAENATFTLGNPLTIVGVVSAAGRTFVKEGASRLVLVNDANTIGAIVVNEGALYVAKGTANGGAVVTLKADTSLLASENMTYSGNTVIEGNVTMGFSGNRAGTFSGSITESGGKHQVTWTNTRNGTGTTLTLSGANAYSGGSIISQSGNAAAYTSLTANGALGSGDVTLNLGTHGANLRIASDTSDTIGDSAALYLYDDGTVFTNVDLQAGVSEMIGGLYINDILQAPGTWGATGSGATNIRDDYFTGTGVLVVAAPPADPGTFIVIR